MIKGDGTQAPSPEEIAAVGGDWGGYGEVSGQALIALMQANKLSLVFGNDALVLTVENSSGQVGVYNIPHVQDIANF